MVSGGDRPDLDALRELEEVLRHLEDELASWRRRALSAEGRVAESGEKTPSRQKDLEEANRGLEQRLGQARVRIAGIVDRLRFLEQQRTNGGADR